MQNRQQPLIFLLALVLTGCNTLDKPAKMALIKTDHQSIKEQAALAPLSESKRGPLEPPLHVALESVSAEQPSSAESEAALPPEGLMQRLRQGFRLKIPSNARIDSQIKWYASHQDYLDRVQQRAEPYLHFIVEEAEKRNIPSELALLPIVESGFQPFAYSPGRAAGLWQFIPSTGKHFGLEQNWWYDGRRDVVAATQAALDYLSSLSEQFDGDWELALAGYNAGAGTVQRAIKKNIKKGKPTDYWSLSLPKETMNYVPRLLAVAKVLRDPDAYGLTLSEIPNQPYFEQVDIESQLDLALAADMAEISIEELYKLNPGFNRWATAPAGPHRLSIPVDKYEKFSKAIAELAPEKRLHWTRYKIRSGDSLGAIARKHKTTTALLQQVNKLKGNRIRAGKHLLIPVAVKRLDQYSHTVDARLAKTQSTQHKGNRITHKVRSGDTLWDIARRYNVSHQALARWNGIAPRDTLRLGQTLVIWQTKSKQSHTMAQLSPMMQSPINTRSSLRYKVRQGDSLALIAQKFRVSVSDLRKWNTLDEGYLQPGQRLQLFVDVTEQTL
ncbi:MAG: LysM peptidoglycan-binding domain-containing protein [Sedimenticola sp.]|uniref:LysM peptidoglycan-binding domain-containing protein n=1 Tax=Sedimenticola thiotaurini TaxID=1543721 RepID=A0A558D138_9GAMM|nr:LysM peptidoglycan-binding domain-containing protein [Sedimenticola sp.]TVT54731.1 MAG: LysM peptidoglycan-binding domain-containing protein [Sedimenticola thiotaurini]